PSRLMTTTPVANPPSGKAEANSSGTPGVSCSGWRVYGTILRIGAGRGEHPAAPARASDAPMMVRNRRRLTGSVHSAASSGNSSAIASRNAGLFMYSSSPAQRSGGSAGGVASVSGFITSSVAVSPARSCRGHSCRVGRVFEAHAPATSTRVGLEDSAHPTKASPVAHRATGHRAGVAEAVGVLEQPAELALVGRPRLADQLGRLRVLLPVGRPAVEPEVLGLPHPAAAG